LEFGVKKNRNFAESVQQQRIRGQRATARRIGDGVKSEQFAESLRVRAGFRCSLQCSAPTSPGVQICTAANGASISSKSLVVQASANRTGTLGHMEIWVDSTKQYTETASTSLSAAIMASPGTRQFTVYAVNTDGTVWSEAVTATIR
jgi:hypothetical protein